MRIDDVRVEKKDGVFVITAWNEDGRITSGDGKNYGGSRMESSVTTLDFDSKSWPENAFRPSIDIPNKTRVFVRDGVPRTVYEWLDGKVQVRSGD